MSRKRDFNYGMRMWRDYFSGDISPGDEAFAVDMRLGGSLAIAHATPWNDFLKGDAPRIKDIWERASAVVFIQAAREAGVQRGDVIKNLTHQALYKVQSLGLRSARRFIAHNPRKAGGALLVQIRPPVIPSKLRVRMIKAALQVRGLGAIA